MDIQEAIQHCRDVANGCPAGDRDCAYQHDHLADWLEELAAYRDAMPLKRAQELAKAEQDGMCVIMPFAPGTTFLQDETGEADIVFTGEILFEVKSNEDTEFWDREEVVEELGPMKRR